MGRPLKPSPCLELGESWSGLAVSQTSASSEKAYHPPPRSGPLEGPHLSPILLASQNRHKRDEIRRALSLQDELIICPTDFRPADSISSHEAAPNPEEDQPDYFGNALVKARAFSHWSGLPALADDSGLEIDALGGQPGVRSARFAGENATDSDNVALALERLDSVPETDRTARFTCVIVCCLGDEVLFRAQGVCEGTIVRSPRGTNGFGYDPIFRPAGRDRTFAEMSAEEKDELSHRGRALAQLATVKLDSLRASSVASEDCDSNSGGVSRDERS